MAFRLHSAFHMLQIFFSFFHCCVYLFWYFSYINTYYIYFCMDDELFSVLECAAQYRFLYSARINDDVGKLLCSVGFAGKNVLWDASLLLIKRTMRPDNWSSACYRISQTVLLTHTNQNEHEKKMLREMKSELSFHTWGERNVAATSCCKLKGTNLFCFM